MMAWQGSSLSFSPQIRCSTRALKNARYLQQVAPDAVPDRSSPEGFGTGLPLNILARLHHLRPDDPELQPYPRLAAFLRDHRLPIATRAGRGALFNGTIFFVQPTFHTPSGTFLVADADMNTIVQYAQHAVVPISAYATQYGPNAVAVSPTFIRHSVTLPGTSYADPDVQGWVNAIVTANSLPTNACVAIVSPPGVNGASVGGNSGYHSKANVVYTIFGVFSIGITLQDVPDVYAMVVSHEIAELVVDPNVDGSNPEVCDPCDINCGPLHRCYFDLSNTFLGATPALPPTFGFSYYICAIANLAGVAICPAPVVDCEYAPPKTKPEKVEIKELKEIKEPKEFKIEKIEKVEGKDLKDHKLEKVEHKEIKDIKEHKLEKHEIKDIKEAQLEKLPIEHKNFKPEVDVKNLSAELPPFPTPEVPIEQRLSGLEASVNQLAHFIERSMRPDLSQGALRNEPEVASQPQEANSLPQPPSTAPARRVRRPRPAQPRSGGRNQRH